MTPVTSLVGIVVLGIAVLLSGNAKQLILEL